MLFAFPGSGDAQTLSITDDDNVWSWGDGDYGKLGRGGSDGCKVPMKVDSLAGLGKHGLLLLLKSHGQS
jgi:E3 ubiquitin-protein ligase HERC2